MKHNVQPERNMLVLAFQGKKGAFIIKSMKIDLGICSLNVDFQK